MTFGSKFQGYRNITLIPHSSSSCVFVIVMFVWVLVLVPSNVSTFTTHTSIWNGDWADWARIISCLFLSAVCWIWISFLVVVFRLSLDVKVSAFQLKVSLCRGKVFSSRGSVRRVDCRIVLKAIISVGCISLLIIHILFRFLACWSVLRSHSICYWSKRFSF